MSRQLLTDVHWDKLKAILMIALSKLINTVAVLPTKMKQPSENQSQATRPKFIWRLILGGLPIWFSVTGGEVHDCKETPEFVAKLPLADYMIADKGYDSEPYASKRDQGEIPASQENKIQPSEMRKWIGASIKYRHLAENVFARLKHFRTIASDMTN